MPLFLSSLHSKENRHIDGNWASQGPIPSNAQMCLAPKICLDYWQRHQCHIHMGPTSLMKLQNAIDGMTNLWHGRFATRFARIDSRESFAIETPIFIARQADSPESLEFPIRANRVIRAIRANHATKGMTNMCPGFSRAQAIINVMLSCEEPSRQWGCKFDRMSVAGSSDQAWLVGKKHV